MKRIIIPLFACILLISLTGCAFLDSLRAKKNIKDCQFKVNSTAIQFSEIIPEIEVNFDSRTTTIKLEDDVLNLLPAASKISNGEFKALFEEITIIPNIKIINNSPQKVELDHFELQCFLDQTHLVNVEQKKFLEIAKFESLDTNLKIGIPYQVFTKNLTNKENIIIKGKVFVTIFFTEQAKKKIAMPVYLKFAIPYDQIKKIEQQKTQELQQILLKKIAKQTKSKVKNKIKFSF